MTQMTIRAAALCALLFVFMAGEAAAATCTSVQSGNWNTTSTWSCTGGTTRPSTGDSVIIVSPYTVTLDGNRFATNLQIDIGATLDDNGNDLTVSGSVTINGIYDGSGNNGNLIMTGNGQTLSGMGTIIDIGRIQIDANTTIPAGSNLNLTLQSEIRVGDQNPATLTIDGIITGTAQTNGNRLIRVDNNNTSNVVINGTVNAPNSFVEVQAGGTVTNNGTVTLQYLDGNGDATSTWTQGVNSSLIFSQSAQGWVGTFNASATGNTVTYNSPATPLTPSGNTYYNLAGTAVTCPHGFTVTGSDPCPAGGPVSVTLSPGTCASDGSNGSTLAWSQPTRAISNNASYATRSLNDGQVSQYLRCSSYGFAIPAGATITGITVNVERRAGTANRLQDAAMRLVKDVAGTATIQATDRSTATFYPTTETTEAHGGATDLWGGTWTPDDINLGNFGAALASQKPGTAGGATTASVDHMPITVTYTVGVAGPHHIQIDHDGGGLTCSAETVTIKACADNLSPCTLYTGGVNVTLTPGGQTFAIDATGINSAASVQQSTTGSATLSAVSVPAATDATPTTCVNTSDPTSLTPCAITFSDSGFIVTVPNHTSCSSATATIEAVQTAPGTGRCVPAYQNVTQPVNLSFAYTNPASGTQSINVLSGSNLATITTAATTHTLTFNNVGAATLVLSYADAGKLTLTANGTAPTGATMTMAPGSGIFIAAPASFAFSGIPAAPLVAGQAFNVSVTAMNACATPAATLNFNGTVTLSSSNPLPALGNATAINQAAAAFTNGVSNNSLTWDEVGTIDLKASLSVYLGWDMSTAPVTGTQTNVGRFQPGYFDTTVTPGCATFTYAGSIAPAKAGQPFTVTVKAKRFGGDATDATNTANYAGAANAYLTTLSNAGVATGLASNTIPAANFANGVGSANVTYAVAIPETAPLTLSMRATNADPTPVSSSGHAEGTADIRSGRAKLGNAHGSELLSLPVPFRVQHWSGNGWVTNNADTCSGDVTLGAGNAVSVALSALPVTCVQDSASPGLSGAGCAVAGPVGLRFNEGATPGTGFSGDFNLWLQAPGAGNVGAVTVTGSVPTWLQFAWGGGVVSNPTARATFGVYKGNNEFIYLRENY